MEPAATVVEPAATVGLVTAGQVWAWLAEVPDPEIPVISIVDLGIVRAVDLDSLDGRGTAVVTITITPTYSGCPAMAVIADAIMAVLRGHGLSDADVTLQTRIAPAWTTDWISGSGKARLRDYGIAPPRPTTDGQSRIIDMSRLRRRENPAVRCPHCGAAHTEVLSQFGSTPCKALYRCLECREPFDYFKPL
jgi:ring-1,2-phenylacetyl-CoA epoxidase subunit PaaD